jgi:hypothetical protein
VTATEAIAVAADLEEAKRLAAEFEATGSNALTMAIAQEAKPGDHSRMCWLAHERQQRKNSTLNNLRYLFSISLTPRFNAWFTCSIFVVYFYFLIKYSICHIDGRAYGTKPRREPCAKSITDCGAPAGLVTQSH